MFIFRSQIFLVDTALFIQALQHVPMLASRTAPADDNLAVRLWSTQYDVVSCFFFYFLRLFYLIQLLFLRPCFAFNFFSSLDGATLFLKLAGRGQPCRQKGLGVVQPRASRKLRFPFDRTLGS
jgi:hypothetical protein